MDALVKEGKVRLKGQSAYSADHFEKVVPVVSRVALRPGPTPWTTNSSAPARASRT